MKARDIALLPFILLLCLIVGAAISCSGGGGDDSGDDDDDNSGDDDAGANWTCEEAVGAYVDECCGGVYDCEMWRADLVNGCESDSDEQRQIIADCYFEYWPDCAAISTNCPAMDFSDG